MTLPPFSPVSPYSQRNNMPSVRQYIEMVSVLIHLRFPHEVHLLNHPKEIPKRNTPKNTPKEITSKKYPKEIPQRNTLKKFALNSACRQHYSAGGLERSPPPSPCVLLLQVERHLLPLLRNHNMKPQVNPKTLSPYLISKTFTSSWYSPQALKEIKPEV